MGWFSADEVINVDGSAHNTIQTVALSVLAITVLGYGVLKIFNSHHRHQSEQAARAAVHIQSVTSKL